METVDFLSRTVAPGNYFCICFKSPGRDGMGVRMFPGGSYGDAAGFVRAMDRKGADTYFAMASFTMAVPKGIDGIGRPKFTGARTHDNTQALKAFWIDFDVHRKGDKKSPGAAFDTQADAVRWLRAFLIDTGLPRPNQITNSGYGLHVYWVLEDAMAPAAWQPYADTLKALLADRGFKGDIGITADAARVLRPIGTHNHKVPATPAAVDLIGKLTAGEIPNQLMLDALQPHMSLVTQFKTVRAGQGGGAAVSSLAGGSVPAAFQGAAVPNMAAAAQAGTPNARRPRSFALMAAECEQIKLSLANHGAGDQYPLWYLGHLTAAHFCTDGADFVHEISKGDPKYTPAGTDAAVAQIAREQQGRGVGFPGCALFDRGRPNVCKGCKHYGRVRTPLDLALDNGDLPEGWRRHAGFIQQFVKAKDEGGFWRSIVVGDVCHPLLDEVSTGGTALNFTYELAGRRFSVRVAETEMPHDAGAIKKFFGGQGITLSRHTAMEFGDLMTAWITMLREQRAERPESAQPFGWATDAAGKTVGFAVAGTLYRADGHEEPVPGGDKAIIAMHTPRGSIEPWKRAAALIATGRPEFQTILAASFGAPLMHLTGLSGLVIAPWSSASGVGKTSALTVAQTVWGMAKSGNSLDDTNNAVMRKAAETRALPILYDEARASGADGAAKLTAVVFQIVQGKEKARLNHDATARELGEWETLLVACSNRPLSDDILKQTEATEAGLLRNFEYQIVIPSTAQVADADMIFGACARNYGHAGRIYAAEIARRHAKISQFITKQIAALGARLGAGKEERFYTAGMAVMLTGALLAKRLDLVDFDVPALEDFLCDTFLELRRRRRDLVVSHNGKHDLHQILASYVSEMNGRKLVTDRFASQGGGKVTVVWSPTDRQHADIHISQKDQIMRISRAAFRAWCSVKMYPPSTIVDEMVATLGASIGRKVIGTGTGWAGGQMPCIDIPLLTPDLALYLA